MEATPTKRITRAQLVTVKRQLIAKANGACPLCGCNLLALPPANVVVDHCHDTGVIRGVLCRGCNGAEGKVKNSVQRWGKAKDVVKYLKRLLAYYETPSTSYIYPSHKTDDEKRLARNAKARKAYKAKKLEEYRSKQDA